MALSASFILNPQSLHRVPSLPPTNSALNSDLRFNNQSGHNRSSSSSNWLLSFFFSQKPPITNENLLNSTFSASVSSQSANVEQPTKQNNILLGPELNSDEPISLNYEPRNLNYAISDETINLNYSNSKQRIESGEQSNSNFNYLSSESSQVLADLDQGAEKGARRTPKRVIFTPQKARELRKKLKDTYNFHDVMYHSAIANRLANLDN